MSMQNSGQMLRRAAQKPGRLRQENQPHPEKEDRDGTHERGGSLHVAESGKTQEEAYSVAAKLDRGAAGGTFGEVTRPEVTMLPQPAPRAREPGHDPGLQQAECGSGGRRRPPRQDEPEHVRVTSYPQEHQGG